MTLFDLENDLPDELIRNGDMVPDAAAKHKQLSELLRAGSSTSLGGGLSSSSSPQPGNMGGQLASVLGKSPLGQGSQGHPSPQGQKGGQGNGGPGMGGFGQAMMNSGQVMGQVMNGVLGPGGRGRPGMQYQGQALPGAGVGGSVLAETLTQGGAQMGAHNAMNAQQAGNMNKVRGGRGILYMSTGLLHWESRGNLSARHPCRQHV